MKKSFTLIEVLVSIALFSIILLFLYQSLEVTKTTNNFFENKIERLIDTNHIKKIILLDIAQSSSVEISQDGNSNNILIIKTDNLYHNTFYKYVTYLNTQENNLVRIESLTKFDKKTLSEKFFETSYLDVLLENTDAFKVSNHGISKDLFSIMIKQEKNKRIFFSTLKLSKTSTSSSP